MKYYQVYISAETKEQADTLLDSLLKKKLVAGGLLLNGPARFWWQGNISRKKYYNISAFTINTHKQDIIAEVKRESTEEVPMIWFVKIDGNKEFVTWIRKSVG